MARTRTEIKSKDQYKNSFNFKSYASIITENYYGGSYPLKDNLTKVTRVTSVTKVSWVTRVTRVT